MSEDHFGRQRFVNVVDQRIGDRASVEVYELAAELVRQRRVAAHRLLLFRALRSGPN